jgi:hypothetical protein
LITKPVNDFMIMVFLHQSVDTRKLISFGVTRPIYT